MPKKLRTGLLDPHEIPHDDIPDYLATTYGGYLREVQNRLWEINHPFFRTGAFTSDFYRETLCLQLRICIELLCFAVFDFDQMTGGLVGKSKRADIDLKRNLKKRKGQDVWPQALDPHWEGDLALHVEAAVPTVQIPDFRSADEMIKFKGRLDKLVHGQKRPRPDETGLLALEDVIKGFKRLKHFADRQLIVDMSGQGWFLDSRPEYRRPVDRPSDVRIIKIGGLYKSK